MLAYSGLHNIIGEIIKPNSIVLKIINLATVAQIQEEKNLEIVVSYLLLF